MKMCRRKFDWFHLTLDLAYVAAIALFLFAIHIFLKVHRIGEDGQSSFFYWFPMIFALIILIGLLPWHSFRKPMSEEDRQKYYRIM